MSACAQPAPEEPPLTRPPGAAFAAIGRDAAAFAVPPGDVLIIFEDDAAAAHAGISEGRLAASSDAGKGNVSWTSSL